MLMIKNNGTKKLTKLPAPFLAGDFVFFRRVFAAVVGLRVAVVFRAIVFYRLRKF